MLILAADKAKRYSSLKYQFAVVDIFYLLILLFFFQASGISSRLAQTLSFHLAQPLIMPAYILIISVAYYIFNLPLNVYSSFILERKFGLSAQEIGTWFKDQLKAGMVFYVIIIILLGAFYYILIRYPQVWWFVVSLFWIFFSLVLAKLTPVIIIPLFFKYKKFSDEALRERIMRLAEKMRIKILDVFEIDFSKKTLKANAAFVGIGSSKRVILADTLKDKYNYDEVEVVLAHEFAHYQLKHLVKLIIINALGILLFFWVVFKTSALLLGAFNLSSLSDIAAFPILVIYMVIFETFTQPIKNYLSRRMEKNADMLAIKATGRKDAFISTMEKLATQNLADRNPHPIIKFFFFDHPAIDERIRMAKSL